VELFQAGDIYDDFGFRRVALGVIFLGCMDDQVDHIREASATATALRHGMIDFCWNDKLPTVLVKELDDRVPDFPVGDVIATANQHSRST